MTTKNEVTNTSAESRRDPLTTLAKVAFGGGIEASERRGQLEFLESETLPSEVQDLYEPDQPMVKGSGRALLESWGFVFGKVCGGDTLFQQAKLPPGWSKKGGDHAMWTTIVDEKGRERCSIFYKAAFYDRSAHLSISGRYRYHREYQNENTETTRRVDGPQRGVIQDRGAGDAVLFTGPWREDTPEQKAAIQKRQPPLGDLAYELVGKDMDEWSKANLPQGLVAQWAAP
jgi:hypothetical protein